MVTKSYPQSTQDSQSQWEDGAQVNDYFDYSLDITQTKWQEDSSCHYYKVALPGLTDKNIDVKVTDNKNDPSNPIIVIRAAYNLNSSTQDHPATGIFPNAVPFFATFQVPIALVKVDDIQASIDNGVLTIRLPKVATAQSQSQGRAIPLNKSRL
ncbi:hypothetical protein L0F63_002827 [Massospora cicadina]|nr:hypothetical protein L0F63_002827 [Massospora cicadina]